MSVENLLMDFDLRANDDNTWTLVALTATALDWVRARFTIDTGHPILDIEGTAMVINMIQRDHMLLSIDGEWKHG